MRRALKRVAVGVGALLGLILVAVTITHAVWNHERAARSISRWASKSIAGHGGPTDQGLAIARVDYALWPAVRSLFGGAPVRVDVWGFTIWDPDGHEVLAATHVSVGLDLGRLVRAQIMGHLPLFRSDLELHFHDAIIDEVRCLIQHDSQGKVNLIAAFKRESAEPRDPKAGMVITVNGSKIVDGTFTMKLPKWSVVLPHMNLVQSTLRYSSFAEEHAEHAPAFTYHVDRFESAAGTVDVEDHRFTLDRVVGTELVAENPDRTNLHLALVAQGPGMAVDAKGMLTDVYSPDAGTDLFVGLHVHEPMWSELPTKKYLFGNARAAVKLSGPFHALVVQGSIHGLEGKVGALEPREGEGRFHLAHGTLELTELRVALAGGHVTGSATVHLPTKTFRVTLWPKDLHALELGRFMPVDLAARFVGFFARRNAQGLLEDHLHLGRIDIGLFRDEHGAPPEHAVIRNDGT